MTATFRRHKDDAITAIGGRFASAPSKVAPPWLVAIGTVAAAQLFACAVHAAGGHHAIDDAALLDPGQCQLETWWDREAGGARTLLHAGPGCRIGPVEMAVSLDRTRLEQVGSTSITGLQVKWARSLDDYWSIGVAAGTNVQSRAPRYVGSTVIVPITWQATSTLLAHANIGRDFRRGEVDTFRGGLAVEWAPLNHWAFVAEHFREFGSSFRRAGVRWNLSPAASIDLSRARAISANSAAWWTLGLTWVWS